MPPSLLTDDLDNSIWSQVPIAIFAQERLQPNTVQIISRKFNNNIVDVSISLQLSINQYLNDQHSSIEDRKVSIRIMWRIIQPINPGSPWNSIVYFSTLPYGWIPDDGMDLFQHLFIHLRERWLDLCHKFGKYLSDKVCSCHPLPL